MPLQRQNITDAELQEWIAELRSGRHQQVFDVYQENGAYCALGVLYFFVKNIESEKNVLDLGELGDQVVKWNDNDRRSLSEIADLIEEDQLLSGET